MKQIVLSFLLSACGQFPLQLEGELSGHESEVVDVAIGLGDKIGADVLKDLEGWDVEISASSGFIECGGSATAIGCTEAVRSSFGNKAWIRLSKAARWDIYRTALAHELLHVWLTAKTGDGDPTHAGEIWKKLH